MQREPNAILHMTGLGFIYGMILSLLYMWAFGVFWGLDVDVGETFFLTVMVALAFGGLPGLLLGFIQGIVLWRRTYKIQVPMSHADYDRHRHRNYLIFGCITFVCMSSFLSVLHINGYLGHWVTVFFILIPALIAGGASANAAQQYLERLQTWGESFEKPKNKAKHPPQNKLAYDDNLKSDAHITADEAQHAQMRRD